MNTDDTSTTGGRLRAARKACGLTQAALAKRMGITTPMVSFVETGVSKFSASRCSQAAEILSVSLDWLIRGVGRGPDSQDFLDAPRVGIVGSLPRQVEDRQAG